MEQSKEYIFRISTLWSIDLTFQPQPFHEWHEDLSNQERHRGKRLIRTHFFMKAKLVS